MRSAFSELKSCAAPNKLSISAKETSLMKSDVTVLEGCWPCNKAEGMVCSSMVPGVICCLRRTTSSKFDFHCQEQTLTMPMWVAEA